MDGNLNLLIWFVLIVIAVSDAREYRIANSALLIILMISSIDKFSASQPLVEFSLDLLAGIGLFAIGFAVFFVGAFAPGDVKLLGVVGFVVGWGQLSETLFWILVSGILVGLFYLFAFIAKQPGYLSLMRDKFVFRIPTSSRKEYSQDVLNHLYMPFAPIVVIGLALWRYFV